MIIKLRVEKISKAFLSPKLVYVAGYSKTLNQGIKGYVSIEKAKFLKGLKTALKGKDTVVVSINVVESNVNGIKKDRVFINPGNQKVLDL